LKQGGTILAPPGNRRELSPTKDQSYQIRFGGVVVTLDGELAEK